MKPVFLNENKRSKKNIIKKNIEPDSRTITLTKIENNVKDSLNKVKTIKPFENIDDLDDLNPEEEYENWKKREFLRYKRDIQEIELNEQIKNEQFRNKLN